MDGIVGKVGGRYRISLTESTMMKILHSAMDKSHERVKSEQGVILRLTEISKFYELAVMLLDGCLRFVQDEADNNATAMEEDSSDENVVGELAEIRDRLRGRLRETELAIAEKDAEFGRRLGGADQSPELKRFDSLGVDFRLEKLKGEGNLEEAMDEEFSELQHSVDQQVMNIKQKLGPEYKMVEKRRNKSVGCLKIDQMCSDIDILKGTMDLAFGKMHAAISVAESEKRGEQQWGWEVERGTTAILIRGIVEDLEEKHVSELHRRGRRISIASNLCLMDLMRCLQDESESQSSSVERRVKEVFQRIHSIIEWCPKEEESFGEYDKLLQNQMMSSTGAEVKEELLNEIEMLQNGKEELQFQIVTMEKTYLTVIEGFLYECRSRFSDHGLEIQMKEEIVKENLELQDERTEGLGREEVYRVSLGEAMKEITSSFQSSLAECHNCSDECETECKLREETVEVIFRETCRDWNKIIERHEAEGLSKEVCLTVIEESLRDIAETGNNALISLERDKDSESCQCIEYSVEEDIWMVFLREMWKRWQDEIDANRHENFLKEEVFKVLVSEVIREANEILCKEEGSVSADGLHGSSEVGKEQDVFPSLDFPVNVKKQNRHLHLAGSKEGESSKLVISRNLLSDMIGTCSSVGSNVQQAINQLVESKRHLNEIRGGLGVEDEGVVATYDDHTAIDEMDQLRPEGTDEVKLTLSDSAFEPVIGLWKVFMDFQCAVEQRLRSNNLRLEEARLLLTPMTEVVASLKRKETQYAEAFVRCCDNLRKAETEVDLLGDQVDALLGLLEKIYQILYHYAPVLQQHFEVSGILLMIKRELINQNESLE